MNYFSTPVMIGPSAYAVPDFPDPESLIAHLDYLGIDRALVLSAEAQNYSPAVGNRMLVEQLEPFCDRLYPAFVITPADFFDDGTLDWLKTQAQAGNRAYCIRPEVCRYPIRQIERMLTELAEYHPVIFHDSSFRITDAEFHDLEFLAGKFPTVTFIVCKQMWSNFGGLLDLMWKRANVGVDISWLHMRDTFELIRDRFGIERLFFGIGLKTQYGAAVGALAHSQLSPEDRERVAHRNLERLLGIAPAPAKLAHEPDWSDKPYWKSFKEGHPLTGIRVCDAHTHLAGPMTRGWFLPESDPAVALDHMVEAMDRYGVQESILIGERALFGDIIAGNVELEQLAAKYPERFRGYWVFNPRFAEAVNHQILDEFFARRFFVGFKLLPAYWKIEIDDPRYDVILSYANLHRLPILIHTWGDAEALKTIAPRYPDATFILGHSGGSDYGRRQAGEIAAIAPNTCLDSCAIFCSSLSWVDCIRKFGHQRCTFGSDAAAHNEAYELANVLSLPLPDRELIPILGASFDRILARRR